MSELVGQHVLQAWKSYFDHERGQGTRVWAVWPRIRDCQNIACVLIVTETVNHAVPLTLRAAIALLGAAAESVCCRRT